MTTAIHLRACASPLGAMTIAARTGPGAPNGGELVGVWFDGQTHDRAGLPDDAAVEPGREGEPSVLAAARTWLERYFAGEDPGAPPPLAPAATAFQQGRPVPVGPGWTRGGRAPGNREAQQAPGATPSSAPLRRRPTPCSEGGGTGRSVRRAR